MERKTLRWTQRLKYNALDMWCRNYAEVKDQNRVDTEGCYKSVYRHVKRKKCQIIFWYWYQIIWYNIYQNNLNSSTCIQEKLCMRRCWTLHNFTQLYFEKQYFGIHMNYTVVNIQLSVFLFISEGGFFHTTFIIDYHPYTLYKSLMSTTPILYRLKEIETSTNKKI